MIALSLNGLLVIIIISDFGTGVTVRFNFSKLFFKESTSKMAKTIISAPSTATLAAHLSVL